MPMRKSKTTKKRIDKVISLKPPKGFVIDDIDSDVVGFRRKGKPKVGISFSRIPKAPKFKGKKKTKRKKRKS